MMWEIPGGAPNQELALSEGAPEEVISKLRFEESSILQTEGVTDTGTRESVAGDEI